MCKTMNESLNSNYLSSLHQLSFYSSYYEPPEIIYESVSYTSSPLLLFLIDTKQDHSINLYTNNFICICLDTIKNGIHKVTIYYNIITNTFNLFFKCLTSSIPNNLIRKCALSLQKLSREGTPTEIKKILG